MFHRGVFLAFSAFCLTMVAVAEQPQQASDANGDPLPPGAVARLGAIRWRHEGAVHFAAFLPDGKRVVSVGEDQVIRLWEFPSGKALRSIPVSADPGPPLTGARTGEVATSQMEFAAALNSDGKTIASYFQSKLRNKNQRPAAIRLHEVDSGKELPSLTTNNLVVSTLAFSPDGQTLISMGSGGVARVWDWANAKLLRSFSNPNKGDIPLVGSKAGGSLLTKTLAAADQTLFSPDGSVLMFYGRSNAMHFVDIRTGKETGPTGNNTGLTSVLFTEDGRQVITKGADGSVDRWEVASSRKENLPPPNLPPPKLPKGPIARKASISSRDGKIIAGITLQPAKGGGFLELVDSATGNHISQPSLDTGDGLRIATAAFSADDKLIAVLTSPLGTGPKAKIHEDTKMDIFEVATGKRVQLLKVPPKEESPLLTRLLNVPALLFSPDNQVLAANAVDSKTLVLWDIARGKPIGSIPLPEGAGPEHLAFSADSRCLALDMNDGTVLLYELSTITPRRRFGEATREAAAKLRVGSPSVGPLSVLREPDPGTRVAISRDGNLLALGGQDHSAYIWNILTRHEAAAFKGHAGAINSVAFSPDGKLLASASADTTALLWDLGKLEGGTLPPKVLKPAEVDQSWQSLESSDGIKAFAAMCDLIAAPQQAVAWIKDKVKPVPAADIKTIENLIALLDDNQFKVRDKASAELIVIGEQTVPALERTLLGNLPLETKRRIEGLRDRLTSKVLPGDRLRNYRAVEVLERIGTPEARQVLQNLAGGNPGTLLTTSANAALQRMHQ
jgi:WD40 repeat protein